MVQVGLGFVVIVYLQAMVPEKESGEEIPWLPFWKFEIQSDYKPLQYFFNSRKAVSQLASAQ